MDHYYYLLAFIKVKRKIAVALLIITAIFRFSGSEAANQYLADDFEGNLIDGKFKLILWDQKPGEVCLGLNEAIRTYVEFADGTNRGMYDPVTGQGGYPDEDYDATTAMVINWHSLSELDAGQNSRLEYRLEHPFLSPWEVAEGESHEFWHRDERVNRVLLTGLQPNSVYAYRVRDNGKIFRFRTMPASLHQRPVTIVMTSDHQTPSWSDVAFDIAQMTVMIEPDLFLMIGDFINCEGRITSDNAERWALYLDMLYSVDNGFFIYEKIIDGRTFSNMVIPHVGILGNHETGDWHHLRRPACTTTTSTSRYPEYTAANWMELLFHFPFSSEGFYSEFRFDHPNINSDWVQDGYGHGGFGKLSFADYLLLIGLDNSQNWVGEPDQGLRDWQGNLITEHWPWFEIHHADVRQDLWLKNLLEPKDGVPAGQIYTHIIPVWHRGLFGSVRMNMTLKNRELLEYWLPILYRNGAKFIGEAHDHLYARSVPMGITCVQPENTYLKRIYYNPEGYDPNNWDLEELQKYLDEFFAVNCIKDDKTNEIIGWEYKGNYITYDPQGMRAFGYGGWAANRRSIGHWGAGNAGWWFRNPDKGGDHFSGDKSFHINVIHLTPESLVTEAIHPSQLSVLENGDEPQYIHRIMWDMEINSWSDQNLNRYILDNKDTIASTSRKTDYPDAVDNPESRLMLAGDWVPEDTHDIDFFALPKIPSEHSIVSDVRYAWGRKTNQHNYLVYFDGRFWAMWSDGPGVARSDDPVKHRDIVPGHDQPGQLVSYSTSKDGINWSEPRYLTDPPFIDGFGWIARGFWVRDGKLLALVTHYNAPGYRGEGLQLHAYEMVSGEAREWKHKGLVYDNAMNNFSPKMLPDGKWMMSRRDKDGDVYMLVGGTENFDKWESFPVISYQDEEFHAEEPYWLILPDNNLVAFFRDNKRSGFLYRAFSTDNGRSWSRPVRTNFPDARSKFSGLRLSDGRYILVSNSNPKTRDPLTISISDDGMAFTKMGYLVGGRQVDYPHVIEHDGYIYVAHASAKQTVEVHRIRISDLDNLKMPK